jgi:hypothetical protein
LITSLFRPRLLLLALLSALGIQAFAQECREGVYDYRITREGLLRTLHVGHSQVTIRSEPDGCLVLTHEWLQDGPTGITQYCHHMARAELWREDTLEQYENRTVGWCGLVARKARPTNCAWPEGNATVRVVGMLKDGQFQITAGAKQLTFDEPVVSSSFLAPGLPADGRRLVIDPVWGVPEAATMTALKDDEDGATHEFTGDRLRKLWYQDGVLTRMQLVDDEIDFILVTKPGEDPLRPEASNEECEQIFSFKF